MNRLIARFRRNSQQPVQQPEQPAPICRCSANAPCCPCGHTCCRVWCDCNRDWCGDKFRAFLAWVRRKWERLCYLYRDLMGTLPKRSFLKSSGDYYEWLVMVLFFAAENAETRQMRNKYNKAGQTLKRSQRRLLVGFFEHYIKRKRECGKEPWSVIMMMVEYCRNAHPELEDYVVTELLKIAIKRRHREVVRILLEMTEHIDRPFVNNEVSVLAQAGRANVFNTLRPLSQAVQTGDVSLVQILLDRGAKLDADLSTWERPVLLTAVHNNNLDVTKLLLAYGANPYVKDQGNRNALHFLVRNGNPRIAKVLVDLGLHPAVKDATQMSALMEACKYNAQTMVRFFLDYCEFTENELNDALRICLNEEMNLRLNIIRMLLFRGANPNGGDSPPCFGQAFERPLDRAIIENMPKIVNELILAGADVDLVLRYRRRFSDQIRRILVKNVVERLDAGEKIGYDYKTILNIGSDSLFDVCWDERRRMSTLKIVPGMSYAVVMQEKMSSFNKAIKEHGIVEVVVQFESCAKLLFPIYLHELNEKFTYMRNRWDRKSKLEGVVSGMWNGMLPAVVVREIADYLHLEDIEGLHPKHVELDDLDDLVYPRGRFARGRRGLIHWRRKSYT